MLICICGKSGSGKSTIATYLVNNRKNTIHIDVDKIAHKVLTFKNVQDNLLLAFGSSVIENGVVNRKVLGNIVFNDKAQMQKLADITWTAMEEEIDRIIDENKDKTIILDYVLLHKTKYFKMSKYRILVDIDYETRKKRIMLRDKITSEKFDLRDKSCEEYNKDDFDFIINSTQLEDVERLVMKL